MGRREVLQCWSTLPLKSAILKFEAFGRAVVKKLTMPRFRMTEPSVTRPGMIDTKQAKRGFAWPDRCWLIALGGCLLIVSLWIGAATDILRSRRELHEGTN
jgi:hypothetical protein